MVLGYLINVYPMPSHSFIRREIAAVEAKGHVVRRYSIRPGGTIVDVADVAEHGRTSVILKAGALRIALALGAALGRPGDFFRALRLAIQAGRKSVQGVSLHLAYFVEACVLLRWCRRDGVEHLHAHFGSNPAAVAMICRALGGPTYSFTAHGIETFDAPEFLSLDEKIARAAFSVGVSQFGRSQLCRWSDPAHWDRIHVVRCGVDDQILGRSPEPVPEVRRLVCVSRLSPEKGHIPLFLAAQRMHRAGSSFELVLVGDGEMRTKLEELAGRLGIGSLVRFAGWLDGAGVIREILASRALVLPSFSEGLPVVLMEAMALGRPCIASQITGIPELVQPGVTGWLVPASDEVGLARAMTEVLDAVPAELDRMGRAGAERVRALHDASGEAERLARFFESALASARAQLSGPCGSETPRLSRGGGRQGKAVRLDDRLARLGGGFSKSQLRFALRMTLGDQHLAIGFHRVGPDRLDEAVPGMAMRPECIDGIIELVLSCRPGAKQRWLTVTFDDGYAEAAQYVEARAVRYPEVEFLLFVCPEKAEKRAGFRWDAATFARRQGADEERLAEILDAPTDVEGENRRPDLLEVATHPDFQIASVQQLQALQTLPNVMLGNHTNCHYAWCLLTEGEARREFDRSTAAFVRLFGPQRHFAFPLGHGFFDESHLRLVGSAPGPVVWGTGQSPYRARDRRAGAMVPRIVIDGRWGLTEAVAVIIGRSAIIRIPGARRVLRRHYRRMAGSQQPRADSA